MFANMNMNNKISGTYLSLSILTNGRVIRYANAVWPMMYI